MEFTQGVRFDSLGLSPEIMRAIGQRRIEESTPVQAGCIPPMMEWRDVIAKAPTGTGKTFAYGIPIVEHVEPENESVQAVILAPTRELAIQITDEMRDLATYKPGVRMVCLYGGAPIGRQIDALKKHPQIVVATPGRLSDHMKRRTVRVESAQTVVLDEADRMLDMGFVHDVTRLLDRMNKRKNLGLFSATISREVMDIAGSISGMRRRSLFGRMSRTSRTSSSSAWMSAMTARLTPLRKSFWRPALTAVCAFAIRKGPQSESPSFCSCVGLTPSAFTGISRRKSGSR